MAIVRLFSMILDFCERSSLRSMSPFSVANRIRRQSVNWSARFSLLVVWVLAVWALVGCQPGLDDEAATEKLSEAGAGEVKPGKSGPVFFEEITSAWGLDFVHQIGELKEYYLPDIMVAGGGVFDFNRDGLLDLILVDSGDPKVRAAGGAADRPPVGCNRIYQQTRPGKFRDVTTELGLNASGYGCGLAIADVNNDGFDDLFFSNFGDDTLWINEGGKRFRNVTTESGLRNPSWGTSATFLDYDRDGLLDLFVTNYVSYLPETRCSEANAAEDFCSPQVFDSTVDRLFRNESRDGKIRFRDVTAETGIASKKGPGLGVIARDFNRDGYPDLYVANDGQANFLWINQGGKSFTDQAGLTGCAMGLQGEAQAGMGIAEADLDFNGVEDIVVTHIDGETNAAYLGSLVDTDSGQQLFYTESGGARGVQKISKPMTGFGVALPDLDNDGDQDMLTVNGRVTRRTREPGADFLGDYAERNQISLNLGDGRFEELQADDPFGLPVEVSRGLVVFDLDNDGRLDCLVTNTGAPARLYLNRFAESGNWVGFQAIDPERGGRHAIGARIELRQSDGSVRFRTIQSDGSYLSATDPRAHFGLGSSQRIGTVRVLWPDQQQEEFTIEQINRYHLLEKGAGQPVK